MPSEAKLRGIPTIRMINLLWQVITTVLQIILGFYGFWFVWRVLLPVLPGSENQDERIAPFARDFTDPVVNRLNQTFRINKWLAALVGLLLVSAASVGVSYLATIG